MHNTLKFSSNENTHFSSVLKERVRNYFKEKNISIHANNFMKFKTIGLISLWFGLYLLLILGNFNLVTNYLLWIFLGSVVALVCINIGHDAIHGAYSDKKWVNELLQHTFNLNGASVYMWKRMHNLAHHTYTNIHGYDEDIMPVPIIRLSPDAELKPIHRFQHLYAFFFYTLATLSWVVSKDYVKFFTNKVGNSNGKPHEKIEYFNLFFHKIIHYILFWVLPIVLMPQHWGYTIIGILSMYIVSGFYLSMVFMMAHAVEEASFPTPKTNGTIENQWYVHQLNTTANFSSTSKIAAFLTGGLNQQVEHHLFPNICSIHYPELSKIVKDTANEFKVPYLEFKNFGQALTSHYNFLKEMGKQTI